MSKTSSANFLLTFGTDSHEISADTLLTTLFATTNILQEISKEISPEKKIDIKIKALKEGSFCVDCSVVETTANAIVGLFSATSVSYAADIIAIYLGIMELKKFLAGKQPKEVNPIKDGVQIINAAGNSVVYAPQITQIALGNQNISDAFSKQFEKLNEDVSVNSFNIKMASTSTDVAKNNVSTDRNDFAVMQNKYIVQKDKIRTIDKSDQTLKLLKLVFVEKNKWSFIYDGNKISAFIRDGDFLKQIDEGEAFAKGDAIVADMKIYQIYDATVDDYINQDYEIVKVKNHIHRGTQEPLLPKQ